jgi:hypothetical protein
MITKSSCNCARCFDRIARKTGCDIVALASAGEKQKILLRAYMEPPWVFPSLVAMVDRRWLAGERSADELPILTRTVEAWLVASEFFDTETPAIVKRLFAGTVAITAQLMFQLPKGIERN